VHRISVTASAWRRSRRDRGVRSAVDPSAAGGEVYRHVHLLRPAPAARV